VNVPVEEEEKAMGGTEKIRLREVSKRSSGSSSTLSSAMVTGCELVMLCRGVRGYSASYD
jgi:hypothetical protein